MSMQPPYGADPQPPEPWPAQPPAGPYGDYSASAGQVTPGPAYASTQSPPGGFPPAQGYPPPMPPIPPSPPWAGGGLAIAGLVFGIFTMLCPFLALIPRVYGFPRVAFLVLLATIPLGVIGIVLSAFGRTAPQRRGVATAGLVLSIVGIGLALLFLLLGLRAAGLGPRLPPIRRFPRGLGAHRLRFFP